MEQKEDGIYIFCGTQANQNDNFGSVNIEGEEIDTYVITYKDAAIVAATVPMKIYSPNKENLTMHQSVVSRVMQEKDVVIPISFGNVFKSKKDVAVLLEKLYPQFQTLFPEISGKFELGLKVIAKQEYLESVVKSSDELQKLSKEVKSKSKDAGYFDRMKLGEKTQIVFNNIMTEIENEIYSPLSEISTASKINEIQGEKMLLNAAFLVDHRKDEEFDRMVNKLYNNWNDKVEFKYTGPWAAYNFVNIRLNIEGQK